MNQSMKVVFKKLKTITIQKIVSETREVPNILVGINLAKVAREVEVSRAFLCKVRSGKEKLSEILYRKIKTSLKNTK